MTSGATGDRPVIAVLGLGEAGSLIAAGLADAGLRVRGYDPAVPPPAGVEAAASDADACRGADLVLSLTTAAAADDALSQSLPGLVPSEPGRNLVVYADANTATAGAKVRPGSRSPQPPESRSPTSRSWPRCPASATGCRCSSPGPGAQRASALLAEGGATVPGAGGPGRHCGDQETAPQRLLQGHGRRRDGSTAGRPVGWLRRLAARAHRRRTSRIRRQHGRPDGKAGSYKHALRRSHEMAAAADLLGELGVPPRVTEASQLWLEQFTRG